MSKEENNKTNGQKVIPKDVWKEFAEFWDNTEWKDLKPADIKKHLGSGKYVFEPIPKDVTSKVVGKAWFNKMKQFQEKGKAFGGKTICFKGVKTTLEELYGSKPVVPTDLSKILWEHIKKNKLDVSATSNEKNTVKVNTIKEMENEIKKLNPKKIKK